MPLNYSDSTEATVAAVYGGRSSCASNFTEGEDRRLSLGPESSLLQRSLICNFTYYLYRYQSSPLTHKRADRSRDKQADTHSYSTNMSVRSMRACMVCSVVSLTITQ